MVASFPSGFSAAEQNSSSCHLDQVIQDHHAFSKKFYFCPVNPQNGSPKVFEFIEISFVNVRQTCVFLQLTAFWTWSSPMKAICAQALVTYISNIWCSNHKVSINKLLSSKTQFCQPGS